jgi:hypothetical protein
VNVRGVCTSLELYLETSYSLALLTSYDHKHTKYYTIYSHFGVLDHVKILDSREKSCCIGHQYLKKMEYVIIKVNISFVQMSKLDSLSLPPYRRNITTSQLSVRKQVQKILLYAGGTVGSKNL